MRLKNYFWLAAGSVLSAGLFVGHTFAAENDFAEWGPPISSNQLDSERGGENLVINKMQLDAKLFNNTAESNVTGSNFIGVGAFANSSGLPTVIQNSGNNVIIQNATILNLTLN